MTYRPCTHWFDTNVFTLLRRHTDLLVKPQKAELENLTTSSQPWWTWAGMLFCKFLNVDLHQVESVFTKVHQQMWVFGKHRNFNGDSTFMKYEPLNLHSGFFFSMLVLLLFLICIKNNNKWTLLRCRTRRLKYLFIPPATGSLNVSGFGSFIINAQCYCFDCSTFCVFALSIVV